jgi:hypothetical protein
VIVPVLLTLFLVGVAVSGNFFAVDFGAGPWVAGGRLFAGLSPYVGPHSPQLAHGSPFVYPALSAVLLAPLSLISHAAAEGIFTALSMAAVVLTLRVLTVRLARLRPGLPVAAGDLGLADGERDAADRARYLARLAPP